MIENQLEIKARSVEEIASLSENDRIREFAMRIHDLKNEAKLRITVGVTKLGGATVGLAAVLGSGFMVTTSERWSIESVVFSIAAGVAGMATGLLVGSGTNDLNEAAFARSEFSSLTTVLASHIITESEQAH